jgi:hypothetical protein
MESCSAASPDADGLPCPLAGVFQDVPHGFGKIDVIGGDDCIRRDFDAPLRPLASTFSTAARIGRRPREIIKQVEMMRRRIDRQLARARGALRPCAKSLARALARESASSCAIRSSFTSSTSGRTSLGTAGSTDAFFVCQRLPVALAAWPAD